MLELQSTITLRPGEMSGLKRHALLFDKLHLVDEVWSAPLLEPSDEAQVSFLQSRGFVTHSRRKELPLIEECSPKRTLHPLVRELSNDTIVRRFAQQLAELNHIDVVPICKYAPVSSQDMETSSLVLQVALDSLPTPGGNSSWEDILDFKTEHHGKEWGLRRWLRSLAKRDLNEAEIRDEIEWTLNEYTKAMEIHRIKASQSFVDVFVITPLEIIENLLKFNWSKIAKGALQVRKRKVELMEAETKALGRECAYVFDARKRFGNSS